MEGIEFFNGRYTKRLYSLLKMSMMSQILQRGTVHGKISHLNLTLKITGLHHLSKQAKLNQCLKIFDPIVDWPYRLALGVHLSSHFL